ncbi:hypothetical protein ANACAC_02000 [Anaerostipes caccae L1-92]|uniref:Uncharacterized protein n=1 Tax=Anaerostipes caccae (strain DSM 14662 / CCUG 47493 / JCM 13470 / NCIMB 13811 / L1-92) TaxID=411490 RepID=B0MEK4_ANACD|nr:hypothetical protein ANACAC_02000 [Anaerostipes caccae L1-92]
MCDPGEEIIQERGSYMCLDKVEYLKIHKGSSLFLLNYITKPGFVL